jgi:hypothetical protein
MKQFFDKIGKAEITNILGVLIVLGCFILMYVMLIKDIPSNNKDVVNTAVGFIMGGALAGVVGYFFGASKDRSNDKPTV